MKVTYYSPAKFDIYPILPQIFHCWCFVLFEKIDFDPPKNK